MNIIDVLLLAVFQGVAEFLPISSSGHLAVLGNWLGIDPEANFSLGIVLHAGTLVAILIFYSRSLLRFAKLQRNRLAGMVILGSVPAAVAGLCFKDKGEELSANLWIVGGCFLATAILLTISDRMNKKRAAMGNPGYCSDDITWKQALYTGLAQAAALLPGISRSGSTIAAGMFAGLNPAA
ncbi:MAG: undecaprenyl-diphosphate phosphatase, partial [Lentisphaeria bacterium]|nr:undecaprenyl-diphosphate phosphatase [Lentisphaeria bacterium]